MSIKTLFKTLFYTNKKKKKPLESLIFNRVVEHKESTHRDLGLNPEPPARQEGILLPVFSHSSSFRVHLQVLFLCFYLKNKFGFQVVNTNVCYCLYKHIYLLLTLFVDVIFTTSKNVMTKSYFTFGHSVIC